MKKVIMFLCMSMFLTTIFANNSVKIDSSSAISAVSSDTSQKALVDNGKEFLKSVAIGVGEGAKSGYEIVVKQQYVYAFTYLFAGLACIIAFIFFIIFYRKVAKEEKNVLFLAIIFLVISVWCGIIFGTHFNIIVQGFINPEYAAIKDIVEMSKQLISK